MTGTDDKQLKPKPRSKRRRWFIAAAVLGAVVLSVVGMEAALRVYLAVRGWTPNCYAGHLSLFRPHPEVGADLAPNFRLKSGVFEISTNSLGLRGPEISLEKPEGTVRIAMIGGSSVYGYLVSDGEEAARVLEQQLRDQGRTVEVINAGVPGYNLFRSLVRFREVVAPLDPDIVVLYAGINDIPYLTSEDPASEHWLVQPVAPAWERWLSHCATYGLFVHRPPTTPEFVRTSGDFVTQQGAKQFRSNLEALAKEVQKVGARLVVCSQASAAQADVDPELKSRLGNDLLEFEFTVKAMAWIREELRAFAKDSGADFIDVAAELPPTAENLGDIIHLTKAGEKKLAAILAEHLAPMIERRR